MQRQTIVLVTCVAQKQSEPCSAEYMYTGSLFKYFMQYARQLKPKKIFIISGKYHLLDLKTVISPYDVNLNLVSEQELKDWSTIVLEQLKQVADLENDYFVFLTNATYRRYLEQHIQHFDVPLYIE